MCQRLKRWVTVLLGKQEWWNLIRQFVFLRNQMKITCILVVAFVFLPSLFPSLPLHALIVPTAFQGTWDRSPDSNYSYLAARQHRRWASQGTENSNGRMLHRVENPVAFGKAWHLVRYSKIKKWGKSTHLPKDGFIRCAACEKPTFGQFSWFI
jgi:hypothetical protein